MEQRKTQSNSGTHLDRLYSTQGRPASWETRGRGRGADKRLTHELRNRAVDTNLSVHQKSGKLSDHTSLPPHKSNFFPITLKKSDAIILSFTIPAEKKVTGNRNKNSGVWLTYTPKEILRKFRKQTS